MSTNRPIITEEDKKLVGSLTKKKRQNGMPALTCKKVKTIRNGKNNVYFNKSADGVGTYHNGLFYSTKNKSEVRYRSSYELRFFQMLESDKTVVNYLVEAFTVTYFDNQEKKRTYVPDILVLDTKGNIIVYEVKPKDMVGDIDVQRKAQACKIYMKQNFGKSDYRFITERDLFPTQKDYYNFLKEIKK